MKKFITPEEEEELKRLKAEVRKCKENVILSGWELENEIKKIRGD